jgi:hypothetical protein
VAVSDPATICLLTTAMADKKLIIADGHHRYETALNYSKNTRPPPRPKTESSTSELPQPAYPEAAVMMTFVNMDSDGLVILPTHRVVHSLANFDPAAFAAPPRSSSRWRRCPPPRPRTTWRLLTARQGTAFVAVTRAGASCCAPSRSRRRRAGRPARAPAPARPEPPALDRARPAAGPGRGKGSRADQHPLSARRRRGRGPGRRGEADVTFLTNPVSMEQLREVAFAGDVMPQKSTDFFPKLLSGLTIYALE